MKKHIREKIRQSKLGVPMSDTHKKNTSLGLKGRVLTEEHKENISRGLNGRTLTEEHKKNISNSRKNVKTKPLAEEHKKNVSNGMKNYWKRKKELENEN